MSEIVSRATIASRRARLVALAEGLPEAVVEGDAHLRLAVRRRTFAYYLDDHHGDGRVAVACKVLSGENEALVAADPTRYFIPAYIGPRGWVGLRLDLADTDWDAVAALVVGSYELVAPKRLARLLDDSQA